MYNEFIGLPIKVVDSNNAYLIGKKGKIIDETKNLIIIEEEDKKVSKILKKGTKFRIKGKIINGNKINKRPEDRVKLIRKLR